jgi:hypothetical protein
MILILAWLSRARPAIHWVLSKWTSLNLQMDTNIELAILILWAICSLIIDKIRSIQVKTRLIVIKIYLAKETIMPTISIHQITYYIHLLKTKKKKRHLFRSQLIRVTVFFWLLTTFTAMKSPRWRPSSQMNLIWK